MLAKVKSEAERKKSLGVYKEFQQNELQVREEAMSVYRWRLGLTSQPFSEQAVKLSAYESAWRMHGYYKLLHLQLDLAPKDIPIPPHPALSEYRDQLKLELEQRVGESGNLAGEERIEKEVELRNISQAKELKIKLEEISLLLTTSGDDDDEQSHILETFSEKLSVGSEYLGQCY